MAARPIPSPFFGSGLNCLASFADLASASAIPYNYSSLSENSSPTSTWITSSSYFKLESAASGAAVEGVGSGGNAFSSDAETGVGAAVVIVAAAPGLYLISPLFLQFLQRHILEGDREKVFEWCSENSTVMDVVEKRVTSL